MNESVLRAINILLVIIEFVVFLVLSSGFFTFHHKLHWTILICVCVFAINYTTMALLESQTIIKLLAICAFFTILSKLLYRNNWSHCIVLAVLYLSIINILDSVFLYLVAFISHKSLDNLMLNPYGYYLIAFSSKIAELLIVTILHGYVKKRFLLRTSIPGDFMRILAFPLISLLSTIVILSAFLKYPDAASYLLLCVIFLLLFDVAAIILLNHFEHQQQALIESRMLQQELKLAQENIASLAVTYENERRLTHDFQNKLLTIQGLIEHDNTGSGALSYINSIVDQQYAHILPVSTHRTVADVILNQKYQSAVEKQISVTIQLDDLSIFPLQDDALVVILSNLLDNSIEACERITNYSDRKIIIKANTSCKESILCIENSVSEPVKIIGSRIASTKQNSFYHGYGLQNIFSLVSSNGGNCAIHCDNNLFSVVISFPK